MSQYSRLSQALDIFMKYPEDDMAADHDIIWAGPDPNSVSEVDIVKLAALGWHPEWDLDCFYHHT